MDIKYILGVLVIVLLIGNIICIYELEFDSNNSNSNIATLGNKSIEIPNNYSLVNNFDSFEISDGINTLYMYKFPNIDLDSAVADYINSYGQNYTINVEDFDSNFNGKKTIANDNNTIITKYWFELDDGVYTIQINGNGKEYDDIAKNMINSIS